MTKQSSEELKAIVKTAQALDAKVAAQVLVIVHDKLEEFELILAEFSQQARETNVNVQKSFIDYRTEVRTAVDDLRKEYSSYREGRDKADLKMAEVALESAKVRVNSTLSTQEKMEVKKEVQAEMSRDKIDIRGVKISSKAFTYILFGVIGLLGLMIILLPDAISQILIRLGGLIGGGP